MNIADCESLVSSRAVVGSSVGPGSGVDVDMAVAEGSGVESGVCDRHGHLKETVGVGTEVAVGAGAGVEVGSGVGMAVGVGSGVAVANG